MLSCSYNFLIKQGLEVGVLILHSHSFFTRIPFPVPSFITIPNPVFQSYRYIERENVCTKGNEC